MKQPLTDRELAGFWQRVAIADSEDGCSLWTGRRDRDGYGRYWVRSRRENMGAHRLALELHSGLIPEGMVICHTCDRPACVNPAHLVADSQAANIADATRKKRMARGARNGKAKMSEKEVIEARRRYKEAGVPIRQLAREYNLDAASMRAIIRRRHWTHID